ncbi:MAG TPA: HD domain-containing phosphohydrolase [Terracidiphilus sp.]|jgi:putative two-component system response regulator|nr:HD domain-containing phosphohydrolase [Terracidiphilus sp.]
MTYPTAQTEPPSCILIVDDQAPNRELLKDTLIDNGFRVMTASNGTEGLRILEKTQIDLVLLDVIMPGKSGFEVCREIKSNLLTYLIPVVFVTALSDKKSRIRGIRAGADDLLTIPVDRTELLARVRSLLRLKHRTDELERAESVLFSLALTVEARDPNTRGHCERISDLSRRLGERMGMPAEQLSALRLGGVVHDIGKIKVPDAILLKPGPLSREEWVVMREHAVAGECICAPLKSFRLVLPIIRHHHEKRDGSGYPDGLRGDDIPLTARVLQVVDIYDALTSERPYKSAMSAAPAIRIMKEEVRNGWWDPDVLVAFEHLLQEAGPEIRSLHRPVENIH